MNATSPEDTPAAQRTPLLPEQRRFLTTAIPNLQGGGGRRGVRSHLIGHGRRGLLR